MSGVERRRSGAPPRARRRGRVPSLPLERTSPRPLLGYRRCHEHAGPQPLCAAYRTRFRPWCGRQMDRRRDRRAWRSARPDPPQPQPARSWRSDGRSAPVSRPAMSPDAIAAESRSYATSSERLFRSGASPVRAGQPLPGTPAEAYLRARGITGRLDWPALRYHPSVYYRDTEDAPLKAGRRCLLPSPISTAISPASSAPGSIHGGPTKAPLADPRRALGNLLGNGVRFGKATDILAAGEGIETMLALKSVLPSLPVIAGLSANHLAALDLPPAPALRRLYVARDKDAAGLKAAKRLRERGRRRRYRNPRARAGPWRLQPRPLPSRPRGHAGASRGSARPLRPDALSARYTPLRSAAVSPSVISVHRRRAGRKRLFVCGDGMPQPEKSRACGLPERRFAGGEAGLQWRRPTIFRRRPDPPSDTHMGTPLAGAALHREAK